MSLFTLPYSYIADPSRGRPLFNCDLYFGLPDLDPTIPANQVSVSVIQEDGTVVPVPQPVKTGAGGIPLYNGSPVQIDVDASEFSFKALSNQGAQVYYAPHIEIKIDIIEQELGDLEQEFVNLEGEAADIRTTQGTSFGDTNLGAFPGSLIPNGESVKGALTDLESEAEDIRDLTGTSLGATDMGSFSNSLLPSGLDIHSLFSQFAGNVQDELDVRTTNGNASATGYIALPLGTSADAIILNWGSIFAGSNSTVIDNFDRPFETVFQAVVCYGSPPSSEPSAASIQSLSTTQISMRNSSVQSATLRWIAIGTGPL